MNLATQLPPMQLKNPIIKIQLPILRCYFITLLILLVPAVQADSQGTTFTWQGSSGDFGDAAQWNPSDGPPGPADEALINGPGVTISFAADTEVAGISILALPPSEVKFDLAGNILTVSGVPALKMESSEDNPNNTLTITDGTLTLNGMMNLQQGALLDVKTQIFISGSGAVLNTTTDRSIIGFFGYSEVIVENGGVWNNQQFFPAAEGRPDLDIGLNAADGPRAGKGLLRITGAGSTYAGSTDPATPFAEQPRIRVGVEDNAEGSIEILAGGTFEADVVNYGTNPTSVGTALVSGAGSFYSTKASYLGGFIGSSEIFDARGSATVTVADGATATTGILRVACAGGTTFGKLVLDNGTMTVSGFSETHAAIGALFDPGAHLAITLHEKSKPAALVASDRLTITDANLSIDLATSFKASGNDRFILSTYGELIGTFDGLPAESTISVGDYKFRIDYGSGFNDAITLTVIP